MPMHQEWKVLSCGAVGMCPGQGSWLFKVSRFSLYCFLIWPRCVLPSLPGSFIFFNLFLYLHLTSAHSVHSFACLFLQMWHIPYFLLHWWRSYLAFMKAYFFFFLQKDRKGPCPTVYFCFKHHFWGHNLHREWLTRILGMTVHKPQC